MKALTPAMIELLMDCHERELQQLDPNGGLLQTQTTKGLFNRGLVRASTYASPATGKVYMAFFITDLGKSYLKNYMAK